MAEDIWKVEYTNQAVSDLRDIYYYIRHVLLESVAAERQAEEIIERIASLSHMPLRYRVYAKEPWKSKKLRIMPVDNYIVFYLPEESSNRVTIIRIMYGGRDIDKQLNPDA